LIAFLQGKIHSVDVETAIVDVQGVGYEVHCSSTTLSHIEESKMASLFIFTHVREDSIQLYGFSTKTEKELFLSLNRVNGIGPKMAQKILSGTSPENLVAMIESEDVSGLSKLPKVGKKTAEQMILSLKDKLVFEKAAPNTRGPKKDILSALVNLGFKAADAEKVVEKMPPGTDIENGIRLGLQALTQL